MSKPLEQDYFHEPGNSPSVALPDLANEGVVSAEAGRRLEELAHGPRGLQVIAGITTYTIIRNNSDDSGKYEVWIGSRKEQDHVHPNVFSTPTYRLPISYIGGLIVGKSVELSTTRSMHFSPNWSNATDKDRPEVDRFDHVFCSKLGGRFGYDRQNTHVSLASIQYGQSSVHGILKPNEQPRDLEEAIFMLNIIVHTKDQEAAAALSSDHAEYPISTWVPLDQLVEAWNSKDVAPLIPPNRALNEVDLCIHGQCIVSAVDDIRLGILAIHMSELENTTAPKVLFE